MRSINPSGSAAAVGGYSHGVFASGDLLFISGQTPEAPDGSVSSQPEVQFRQIWKNVEAVLDAAGLGVQDLVHVRTYLSDRVHREVNAAIRREVLGDHVPALTVLICDLYEEGWAAEIEAIAKAS